MVTLREAFGKLRKTHFLVTLGVLFAILGAKFYLIQRLGSDVPFWDQWDAEGANMYIPSAEGTLHASHFFSPHNEHRILYTRVLAYLLLKLNGQWDARLQTTVNAVLHVAAIGLLLLILRRNLSKGWYLITGIFLTFLFGLPFSWENTLAGFQSQFYFLFLFSLLHLAGTFTAAPRSWAWWGGQISGLCAIVAMGSGFFSAAVVLGVLSLRIIFARRITANEAILLGWNLCLVALGVALKTDVPSHVDLKSHTLGEFILSFSLLAGWPSPWKAFFPLTFVPLVVVGISRLKSKNGLGYIDFVLGLAGWWFLQVTAIAYARGGQLHGLSPRYFDTLAVGVLASLLLWVQLLARLDLRPAARRVAISCYIVWVCGVVIGLNFQTKEAKDMFLVPMEDAVPSRVDTVADFVVTGNKEFYHARPWLDLPYPTSERLGSLLSSPILRDILPNSIRPPVPVIMSRSSTGFVANGPLPTGKFPAGRPGWSSFARNNDTAAFFRSELIEPSKAHFIRMGVYSDGSPLERAILLETETTRYAVNIPPTAKGAWKYAVLETPPLPYRIIAENRPGTALAFTAPVELAFGSWATRHLLKIGLPLTFLGAACILVALFSYPWPDISRWPAVEKIWGNSSRSSDPSKRRPQSAVLDPTGSRFKAIQAFIQNNLVKLTVGAAAIILFIRKTDVWLYPQFWAEDSQVFFNHAAHFGAASIFTPYAGYHHFLLRCIANMAMHFDIRWAPAIYVYTSIAVTLGVILLLFSTRVDLPYKPLLALAIALVPHTGEVFLNLTNLQWITAIALLIILFKIDAPDLASCIGDCILVFIFGITGPFVILLLPLYIYRAFHFKSRFSIILVVSALLASAIQLEAMVTQPAAPAASPMDWGQAIEIIGFRTFGRMFLGGAFGTRIGPALTAVLGGVVAGILAWSCWSHKSRRTTYIFLWALLGIFSAAAVFRFGGNQGILLLYKMGDRYFFLPSILILWIIILLSERRPYLALVAGLIILTANVSEFRFTPYEDYHWEEYARRINAGEEKVHVVVNPGFVTYDHIPSSPDDLPGSRARFGEHVLAFVSVWLVLLPIVLGQVALWRDYLGHLRPWGILLSLTATVTLGYLSFWAYFASPVIGTIFVLSVWVLSIIILFRQRPAIVAWLGSDSESRDAIAVSFFIGLAYIAILHLHGSTSIGDLAGYRFLSNLPPDNRIPQLFAEHLVQGLSPKALIGDWLSSDRPPLQTGIVLLASICGRLLHFDFTTLSESVGLWYQLIWVPVAWCFGRQAGFSKLGTFSLVVAATVTGFFFFNSIYVWPKLGGAALIVAAFCIWFRNRPRSLLVSCLCGALMALGWLSHGGAAFGIIATTLFILLNLKEITWRNLAGATIAFGVLAGPWLAYQKFYEPPGNRLLKMHLAGVVSTDPRGTTEAIVTAYREAGWRKIVENKLHNIEITFQGDFSCIWDLNFVRTDVRRAHQFYCVFATFWHYNFVWLLLPWLAWKVQKRQSQTPRFLIFCLGWGTLIYIEWILLMFGGEQATIIHQSCYAMHFISFLVLFATLLLLSRALFYLFLGYQFWVFAITWFPGSADVQGPTLVPALASLILIGLLLSYYFYRLTRSARSQLKIEGDRLHLQPGIAVT